MLDLVKMRFDVGESKEGSGMANEAVFFSNLFSEWDCTPSPASSRTSATRPPHCISKMVSKRWLEEPYDNNKYFCSVSYQIIFKCGLRMLASRCFFCSILPKRPIAQILFLSLLITLHHVRMITSDNVQTARAIALECGILTSDADASEPNLGMGIFRLPDIREYLIEICFVFLQNMKPHENWKQLFSIKRRQVMQDMYLNLFFGDEVFKYFRIRGDLAVERGWERLVNIQEIITVCKVASDFGDSGYLNHLSMVFQLKRRSQMLQMAEGQKISPKERMQRQPASYSISGEDLKSGGFPLCHTTAAKLRENGEAESP
ncbi:LOW QUALITY PROTEIN: hypothetical protein HID58_073829 [Brassica napus]|uniref:Uncharacterized protein n=1 Tax=Brassica napus TaxID=3708 RepID=A0ABQ7YF72_BRANA|nr:LOW QUALITY PROTEIN: hypothetical protein HID58_073829 [Brassica napus]